MNKKHVGFLILFVVAIIAPAIFFIKSKTNIALIFGAPMLGLLCAAVAGGLKAYMDTKDDGVLDEKETHGAIFLGVAIFSIVSSAILTIHLFEMPLVMTYYFPTFGHITEIALRVVGAALFASIFFALNILSLTWLVPYIGREYHKKTKELAVAPPAATTTTAAAATPAAATTAPATGAAATTTTTPDPEPKKKGMGIAVPFIVILIISIIVAIGMSSGNQQQKPLPSTQPTTVTTPPANGNGSTNPNGNANNGTGTGTIPMVSENPGQVQH
jgi:MFS family permease